MDIFNKKVHLTYYSNVENKTQGETIHSSDIRFFDLLLLFLFCLSFCFICFFYHCCPVFLFSMRWYFCFPWDERDNLTCHCDLKSEIGLRISD